MVDRRKINEMARELDATIKPEIPVFMRINDIAYQAKLTEDDIGAIQFERFGRPIRMARKPGETLQDLLSRYYQGFPAAFADVYPWEPLPYNMSKAQMLAANRKGELSTKASGSRSIDLKSTVSDPDREKEDPGLSVDEQLEREKKKPEWERERGKFLT